MSEILIHCIWYDGQALSQCVLLFVFMAVFQDLILKDMINIENKWRLLLRKRKKNYNFSSGAKCSWAVLFKKIVLDAADHYFFGKTGFRGFSSLGPCSPDYIMVMWAFWLIRSTTNPRRVTCWNCQQEDRVIFPVTSTAYTSCQHCFICFSCY